MGVIMSGKAVSVNLGNGTPKVVLQEDVLREAEKTRQYKL